MRNQPSHPKPTRNSAIILPDLKFGEDKAFETELHRRVDEYFDKAGIARSAPPSVYVKAIIVLAACAAVYALLVFVVTAPWLAIVLAMALGLAIVGIGVDIQHDGAHNAFSARRWVNRMMAMTMDIIGASSYFWRWKHNRFHHTFTNIHLYDTDIDLGALGRISPSGQRRWYHRWQHLYLWLFYGLLVVKWQIFDDFSNTLRGRLGRHRIPRPRGVDLAIFFAGKAAFLRVPNSLFKIG
jgi:linoleoyl-CoA desaturase